MTHMTDQERAEFEHWYSSEGKQPEVLTKVGESTIYKDSYTGVAWAAWQAARRAPVVQPTVAQVEEAVGMSSTAWDCIEPQAIIDAVMKLAGFGASVVPQFSQVAKKKLDYLLEAGEEITGYAIQNKDGRRGAIDCHGFVYWWNDAAAPQPPATHPTTQGLDVHVQNRLDRLYLALEVCSAELFAQCAHQGRAMKYVDQARYALAAEQCARAAQAKRGGAANG